jgi:hypothetical protein
MDLGSNWYLNGSLPSNFGSASMLTYGVALPSSSSPSCYRGLDHRHVFPPLIARHPPSLMHTSSLLA